MDCLYKLEIRDGKLFLDGKELEGVQEYTLTQSADSMGELNIRMHVKAVYCNPGCATTDPASNASSCIKATCQSLLPCTSESEPKPDRAKYLKEGEIGLFVDQDLIAVSCPGRDGKMGDFEPFQQPHRDS